jgi:formate transporter
MSVQAAREGAHVGLAKNDAPLVVERARLDALLLPAMASRAEHVGVKKVEMDAVGTMVLAVLAGAFIGLVALFSTTVAAGASDVLPYGVGRLVDNVTFLLGLIVVIVGGAELFTGNTLIVMAWASGRVSSQRLLRNWLLVCVSHFVGALATTLLVFGSQQFTFGQGAAGAAALATATAKVGFWFPQAVAPGVLCNALVRLALWLSSSARSTAHRIFTIVPPITAFVAAGFEHSIANMYLIPLGLLIRTAAPDSFWSALGRTASDYRRLTWERFLVDNLLPVTLGNITGGGVLVGIVYWLVFLRPMRSAPR